MSNVVTYKVLTEKDLKKMEKIVRKRTRKGGLKKGQYVLEESEEPDRALAGVLPHYVAENGQPYSLQIIVRAIPHPKV